MDSKQSVTLNGHEFQTFAVAPQMLKHGKTSTRLVKTEHLNSGVQVVADAVVARLGQHEGLLIPHGAPYWFESSSPENLVILRFGAAVAGAGPDRRIDFQQRTFAVKDEAGGVPRPVEYLDAPDAAESTRSTQ